MKFIHIADVHLGAVPDKGKAWSQKRGQEIFQTFKKILERARSEKIDLLLIAGDLFHRQPLLREVKETDYLFSKLKGTEVVLIAGNHDYINRDSYYIKYEWSKNVHILSSNKMQEIGFSHLNTVVHGFSYMDREITQPLYNGLKQESDGKIHILLAHGGDEKHIPIRRQELLESGFDYIALGHIHKPEWFGDRNMAYAGSPEPLDCTETGKHGFIQGEIKKDRNRYKVKAQFCSAAARSYINLILNVTPEMTNGSVQEHLRENLKKYGTYNLFKIKLTGFRDSDILFDYKEMKDSGNIVEVVDETELDYNFEQLAQYYGDSITGRYIRKLMNNNIGMVEKKALYYGIKCILDSKK